MTMNRIIKGALITLGAVIAWTSPAGAQTPQTDGAFVEQLSAQSSDDVLNVLALYYDLHVSEIEVQSMREHNVGAFLAAARAKEEGDTAEAQRQTDIFESTKAALDSARQANLGLRRDLAAKTGIDFGDDLAMAPDAPDTLPPAPEGAPADLLDARDAAWIRVEAARADVRETRMKLLQDQTDYDTNRAVKLGDSMRAMTRVEVAMARAACDLRLIEARLAAAAGKPLAEVLGGF